MEDDSGYRHPRITRIAYPVVYDDNREDSPPDKHKENNDRQHTLNGDKVREGREVRSDSGRLHASSMPRRVAVVRTGRCVRR